MNYTQRALAADALCLGPHWVYDHQQLAEAYPEGVYAPSDPLSPYHPNRKAGQHTHLGDQLRFLSESIKECGGYDHGHWKSSWLSAMSDYDGYIDGATSGVINSPDHSPTESNEFSVVSRVAPILDLGLPVDQSVMLAQQQASITHAGELIPEATEFVVRTIFRVRDGQPVAPAISSEALSGNYPLLNPVNALRAAEGAQSQDFRAAALHLGQACNLDAALPLTLYFALNDSKNTAQIQSENALAGGDNTARAMVLAMILS